MGEGSPRTENDDNSEILNSLIAPLDVGKSIDDDNEQGTTKGTTKATNLLKRLRHRLKGK